MESIKIGKLYTFKNINGKYCTFENKVLIPFSESIVSYHTESFLFIYLNTFITQFVKNLKETIVEKVYKRSIYSCSKETLNEFYVNPHKIIKFCDILKLKLTKESSFLKKGTRVSLVIAFTGIWFGETSFGPYLSVETVDVVSPKSLFISDSDSDSDSEIEIA